MKKVLFMMSVLLSLGMLYACNNEDETSDLMENKLQLFEDSLRSISEKDYNMGCLYYDKDHGGWYVSCHRPGTYDSVDIYYVLNLPEEFKANKEEWVNVSFSGKVVEMTDKDRESLGICLLGGHRYFFVYLTRIEINIEKVE